MRFIFRDSASAATTSRVSDIVQGHEATSPRIEARKLAVERNGHFRAPHHTVSETGLIGELAIAAGGVLLLEDLGEFRRSAVRVLASHLAFMHPASRPIVVATYRGAAERERALAMAALFEHRCHECGRFMSHSECGDELPAERVCDACAGMAPQTPATQHIALTLAERAVCVDALQFWAHEMGERAGQCRASGFAARAADCQQASDAAVALMLRVTKGETP